MSVSSDGESAYDADLKKPLEAIRQEAAETDLAQLKEIALRYKQMLSEKQAEIKLISDKLARIPLKERLSTDAQSLATELKTLAAPVEAIKERLQIYVKAIQARGGDPAGLLP